MDREKKGKPLWLLTRWWPIRITRVVDDLAKRAALSHRNGTSSRQ
jgi:hypothetical protein